MTLQVTLIQPDQARVVRPIGAGTEFRPATNVNLAEEVASADEGEDEAIIVGMRRCDDSDDGCEELVYYIGNRTTMQRNSAHTKRLSYH